MTRPLSLSVFICCAVLASASAPIVFADNAGAPAPGANEIAMVEEFQDVEGTPVATSVAPEPSRAILLCAGICFVLFAYRSAWYNLRKGS